MITCIDEVLCVCVQYQSQEALVADLELMFNNARHYNEESSQVYKDACTLERILMARVHSLPSLDGSPLGLAGKRCRPHTMLYLSMQLYRA